MLAGDGDRKRVQAAEAPARVDAAVRLSRCRGRWADCDSEDDGQEDAVSWESWEPSMRAQREPPLELNSLSISATVDMYSNSKLIGLRFTFVTFPKMNPVRITIITGSIFLSLCVLKNDISKNEVFELSFLDELWQAENWGFDEETSRKRKEISIELNKCIFFLDCL